MAKVVQVTGDVVSIGMDDGTLSEVRACDLNFVPQVGDEVQVFQSETKIIVSKVVKEQPQVPQGGININVSNANNNGQPQQVIYAGKKAVSKIVYCILAFFLGGIGIHKFYAGKIGTGILYLIFSWTFIPAFIAFIEFIIGLCQKADVNGNILV